MGSVYRARMEGPAGASKEVALKLIHGHLAEDEAFIGPGVIILPNVTIGRGAVVAAGSVVSHSVPPMTMVQGNPAKPIAKCGISLAEKHSLREFYKQLRPIKAQRETSSQ